MLHSIFITKAVVKAEVLSLVFASPGKMDDQLSKSAENAEDCWRSQFNQISNP